MSAETRHASQRPTAVDYVEMPVRITRDAVYFGDERLPGCITQGGIMLEPGGGTDLNRLTVTFLVGPVNVDDPTVTTADDEKPQ